MILIGIGFIGLVYRSVDDMPAVFIIAACVPGFKILLPCTGMVSGKSMPSLPKMWWLPLMRFRFHPFCWTRVHIRLPLIRFKICLPYMLFQVHFHIIHHD